MLAVHMLHDMRGLKQFRAAEVFAVRFIESFDFPRRRRGRSGHHLRVQTLQAEQPLDPLPQEFVIERCATVGGLLLPLHFLLDRTAIDRARIFGSRLLHHDSVDGRVLRGNCDGLKLQVVAEALFFLANPRCRDRLPVDQVWHSYLVVLMSTMTPPERSGATRSACPALAGCPCKFSARM